MNREKTVTAIRNRLRTVGCPFADDTSLLAKQTIVNIVSWLEDQCIRLYDIPDRKNLRTNDNKWDSAFTKYLYELNCPCVGTEYNENNKLQCLLWIASHAISVEYEDNYEKYNNIPRDTELSEDDLNLLNSLRDSLLRIAEFLNASVVDRNDICGIIDIIKQELEMIQSQMVNGKLTPLPWKLEDLPITMSTNDPQLRKAMCVMECLYNEDVREIQDKVNYIIEQVQVLTANPETDSRLGVVGIYVCLFS